MVAQSAFRVLGRRLVDGRNPEKETQKHRSGELDTHFRRTNVDGSGFQTPHYGPRQVLQYPSLRGLPSFHSGLIPTTAGVPRGVHPALIHSSPDVSSPALIRRFVGTHSPPPETYRPDDPDRGRGFLLVWMRLKPCSQGFKGTSKPIESTSWSGSTAVGSSCPPRLVKTNATYTWIREPVPGMIPSRASGCTQSHRKDLSFGSLNRIPCRRLFPIRKCRRPNSG